jgi:hypothetical protein
MRPGLAVPAIDDTRVSGRSDAVCEAVRRLCGPTLAEVGADLRTGAEGQADFIPCMYHRTQEVVWRVGSVVRLDLLGLGLGDRWAGTV